MNKEQFVLIKGLVTNEIIRHEQQISDRHKLQEFEYVPVLQEKIKELKELKKAVIYEIVKLSYPSCKAAI